MGKRWIPLESNPEVLNEFSAKLGMDISTFQFQDVFSLDAVSSAHGGHEKLCPEVLPRSPGIRTPPKCPSCRMDRKLLGWTSFLVISINIRFPSISI